MADAALDPKVSGFVASARVGRLATVDEHGQPYVVPFCFVLLDGALYMALDAKPKRVPVEQLKRVRNLIERPQVGVIIDRWSEVWSELCYVQIRGDATLLREGDERERALVALREKYPQYLAMPIEDNPTVKISLLGVTVWGNV